MRGVDNGSPIVLADYAAARQRRSRWVDLTMLGAIFGVFDKPKSLTANIQSPAHRISNLLWNPVTIRQ